MLRARPFNAFSVMEHKTLRTLRKDKEIFILPAGKGRMTVVLDKTDYKEKAGHPLNDAINFLLPDIGRTAKLATDHQKEWWEMRVVVSNIAQFYSDTSSPFLVLHNTGQLKNCGGV